jgi:hypothetical protein
MFEKNILFFINWKTSFCFCKMIKTTLNLEIKTMIETFTIDNM